jgi:hypothetical protein
MVKFETKGRIDADGPGWPRVIVQSRTLGQIDLVPAPDDGGDVSADHFKVLGSIEIDDRQRSFCAEVTRADGSWRIEIISIGKVSYAHRGLRLAGAEVIEDALTQRLRAEIPGIAAANQPALIGLVYRRRADQALRFETVTRHGTYNCDIARYASHGVVAFTGHVELEDGQNFLWLEAKVREDEDTAEFRVVCLGKWSSGKRVERGPAATPEQCAIARRVVDEAIDDLNDRLWELEPSFAVAVARASELRRVGQEFIDRFERPLRPVLSSGF